MKKNNIIFGFLKSHMDAHTMGVYAAATLLRDCGFKVFIAPAKIEEAVDRIGAEDSQKIILEWIKENRISHLGISYRLDPIDAVNLVGKIIYILKKNAYYENETACIRNIHFAGLKEACEQIECEYQGRVKTFKGGETPEETLIAMGVDSEDIPSMITEGCRYDKELLQFGRHVINDIDYSNIKPLEKNIYPEYGTFRDSIIKRLDNNFRKGFKPIIRAHSGPYSPELTRRQCLDMFNEWCKKLATAGFLDVLSIGSSQLSQSNFGENWGNMPNGGGVPVNSEQEYRDIWEAARPMLVRTYSATKNVLKMADVYEKTINNAWHALSLWWFDELDGRGPNSLYKNLCEHIETINYIAAINKPVETNIPHHFAFRGCDDVTYILSSYLGAKLAKKMGVKNFILQNMMNTPRSTWGIQDIAKSRVMIKLVKEIEDESFRVILQTRAGLDYFKPDLESAKVQLAAVTAMMDDIDSNNEYSPEIIHVVSYSEALTLATPDILNDSIKITRASLDEYRKMKKMGLTPDVYTDEILTRSMNMEYETRKIIEAMEENIPDLYSPKGLYLAFIAGWLPVPQLWSNSSEFHMAKAWETKLCKGGISLVNNGLIMPVEQRINQCISNLNDAKYFLKCKMHGKTDLCKI